MQTLHNVKTINNLQTGDHACSIYNDDAEHSSILKSFLRKGFESGAKVLYLVDRNNQSIETLLAKCREEILNIQYYLKHGQLIIFHADDSYLKEDVFDIKRMISVIEKETENALGEGYSALHIIGDMSWVTRGLPGCEFLVEYEAKVNQILRHIDCLAVCQYDRRLIHPSILIEILIVHPLLIVENEVYENKYYLPPEEFFTTSPQDAFLNTILKNFKKRNRNQKINDFIKICVEIISRIEEVRILTKEIEDVYYTSHKIYEKDLQTFNYFLKVLQSYEDIEIGLIFNDEILNKLIKAIDLKKDK